MFALGYYRIQIHLSVPRSVCFIELSEYRDVGTERCNCFKCQELISVLTSFHSEVSIFEKFTLRVRGIGIG